ncbi:MAG: Asp-tRNA(Asn)/Glu-tRNA(Gln) amidotransferase subunit GatB [Deltaproteobacteria bacterium]|nr:Asp-tRNA(Asn)/Glu-tRNA(Gln) amidotransferase subunit GatB [Deltaproteobacteria bacterium]
MYDTFIGLEIHIHLLTKSKQFCGCRAHFGDEPNSNTCPVCLGYPGVLPAANKESMEMSYAVAKALKCTLAKKCYFDRKNYFYPDMAKNYQITQFHEPAGINGSFDIEVDGEIKTIKIHDVHLEEDAGKMIHSGKASLLDYNRAGSSLLEIVTEPDLRTGAEAEAFIREFRRVVRHLNVCDGNMEEGSLRCDANVSINYTGKGLGTKTEVKNLNSARFVRKALEYEIKRQSKVIDGGGRVIQETRLWDGDKGVTASMRTKEEANDYRYFPEPDMPPFVTDEDFMSRVEKRMVELPLSRKFRYINDLKLLPDTADFIVENINMAVIFDEVLKSGLEPKLVANWFAGDVQSQLKRADLDIEKSNISSARLIELINMIEEGRLQRSKGKDVLMQIIQDNKDVSDIVKENGWEQVFDESEMDNWVDEVIAKNSPAVDQIKDGNLKILSFLLGQIMKASKGKADPKKARTILEKKLGL